MRVVILGVLLTAALLCGACYAEQKTTPADIDMESLGKMREKVVQLKREMDLLIKGVMATSPFDLEEGAPNSSWGGINIDMMHDDDNIVIRADLPGIEKDKIELTLERNKLLKISGSRDMIKKDVSKNVVKQERFSGRFERIIELPYEVTADGIKTLYKDGVLEITLRMKKPAKEDRVKINIP